MTKSILLISLVGALGACTTTSFAPPNVNTQNRVVTTAAKGCSSLTADQTPSGIDRNVDGAMNLIDNFELAYRCAQDDLGNGRRYFEVPAFLLGVAGLVGPSLGLSNSGVLLSGAGASVLGTGNSYFAPKAKAAVVGAAHAAVLCIETESVGVSYFKRKDDEAKAIQVLNLLGRAKTAQAELGRELVRGQAIGLAPDSAIAVNNAQGFQIQSMAIEILINQAKEVALADIRIDGGLQYFQMISGALLSIHSILTERMRNSGSAETTGVFTQLKDLAKKHDEAEEKLRKANESEPLTTANFVEIVAAEKEFVTLKIEILRPLIQACVLQARL